MIFNILVYIVARVVLMEFYGPQEEHHRLGWAVGEHNIVFYADNGHIAGRNAIWIQTILTDMVRMFKRVRLLTNICNNKSMVFTLGFIWGQQVTVTYKRGVTGEGDPFWLWKKIRVSCKECVWGGGGWSPLSVTTWIEHTEYSSHIPGG